MDNKRGRVLIVDDNQQNLEILTELLDEDYDLAVAASGEEAVTVVLKFQADLVLLDVMMPGIDGYETCRLLRAMPTLSRTTIIMVTAKAMAAERSRGFEVGADDYVTKPFRNRELLAKLHAHL